MVCQGDDPMKVALDFARVNKISEKSIGWKYTRNECSFTSSALETSVVLEPIYQHIVEHLKSFNLSQLSKTVEKGVIQYDCKFP